MWEDLLTAVALLLILEGLLPGLAPRAWMKAVMEAARMGPKGIRIAGITMMLSGALMLQFLH